MINCPSCGHPVPGTQRFCGNCGTDVNAALPPTVAAANANTAHTGAPITEEQSAPYAYAQTPAPDYGYTSDAPLSEAAPKSRRTILVIAALLLVGCCALACGCVIGIEIPEVLGVFGFGGTPGVTPGPTPRFTPTPSSWLPLLHYFIG